MKYNLGDTIPTIKALNFFDEQLVNQNDPNKKMVFMFLKENTRWDDTEPQINALLTNYPDVSFIVCPDKDKKKLIYFFSESTLRNAKNLFLADVNFVTSMAVKDFPSYVLTNQAGKVLLFFPPLPSKEIAFKAIKSSLDHSH